MKLILALIDFTGRRVSLPTDSDDERARKITVLLDAFFAAPIALFLFCAYLILGVPWASLCGLFYFLTYEIVILYSLRKRDVEFLLYMSVLETLVVPFLAQWLIGGFANSGAISVIAIIGPFAAVYFNARGGYAWFVAFFVLIAFSGIIDPTLSRHAPHLPQGWIVASFVLNFSTALCFIYVPLRYVMGELRRVRNLVELERRRSDSLLLNILPSVIADRLKGGESMIADWHDEVTVLFADIVGFTPLAARLPADVVVGVLNELFSRYEIWPIAMDWRR